MSELASFAYGILFGVAITLACLAAFTRVLMTSDDDEWDPWGGRR